MLKLTGIWIWDFWMADDGDRHHIFFLNAPATGHPHERHRVARIGHAVSTDFREWEVLPTPPFGTGGAGEFDETATWTGCVVRGDDGRWRMFYTGARFLEPAPDRRNVESIGVAISDDLMHWEKVPGPVVAADSRWYETLGSGTWREEAWRDPWVFRDPEGDGWHMIVTARANSGDPFDRGVIGHARSPDLDHWEVHPPLSDPGAGFAHLEVPQVAQVDGRWFLIFSCPHQTLSAKAAERYPNPGTWALPIDSPLGPWDVSRARPLTTSELYAGRVVHPRSATSLLAFVDGDPFSGGICDPLDLLVDESGWLTLRTATNCHPANSFRHLATSIHF